MEQETKTQHQTLWKAKWIFPPTLLHCWGTGVQTSDPAWWSGQGKPTLTTAEVLGERDPWTKELAKTIGVWTLPGSCHFLLDWGEKSTCWRKVPPSVALVCFYTMLGMWPKSRERLENKPTIDPLFQNKDFKNKHDSYIQYLRVGERPGRYIKTWESH